MCAHHGIKYGRCIGGQSEETDGNNLRSDADMRPHILFQFHFHFLFVFQFTFKFYFHFSKIWPFFYQFFITINCDIQFCIHRALKNTTRVEAKRSCHGISGSARMAFQHSLHLMWSIVVFLLTSLVRWQSRQIPISLLLTLQVSQVSFKIGLIPWLSIREVGSTGFGSL